MANAGWAEPEIRDAVREYFRLLHKQESGERLNKRATYRRLAELHPARSAKAFELKFQNISAVLYENRIPYLEGLRPKSNYQRLLKLLVLDHLDRVDIPVYTAREILVKKLARLAAKSPLPVEKTGTGRFGLALEKHLDIPPNSSKAADFMGIELKTKHGSTLQTLFSRTPTRYTGCRDKAELCRVHGYYDEQRGRQALYTSFSSRGDSLGFSLRVGKSAVVAAKNGLELFQYDFEELEAALLTKHTETAFVAVTPDRVRGQPGFTIKAVTLCKWPSILRLINLIRNGSVNLDLTLSLEGQRVKDHGFLWRIRSEAIQDLYLDSHPITF